MEFRGLLPCLANWRKERLIAKRAPAKGLFSLALTLGLACLTCPHAWGDVGIVLNESMDTSVDRISGTGHSAVYFSRICAESPVRLRLCHPNENGSVMSNYINIGEDQRFEWNIVPLNIYLYGVEDPRYRPLLGLTGSRIYSRRDTGRNIWQGIGMARHARQVRKRDGERWLRRGFF